MEGRAEGERVCEKKRRGDAPVQPDLWIQTDGIRLVEPDRWNQNGGTRCKRRQTQVEPDARGDRRKWNQPGRDDPPAESPILVEDALLISASLASLRPDSTRLVDQGWLGRAD